MAALHRLIIADTSSRATTDVFEPDVQIASDLMVNLRTEPTVASEIVTALPPETPLTSVDLADHLRSRPSTRRCDASPSRANGAAGAAAQRLHLPHRRPGPRPCEQQLSRPQDSRAAITEEATNRRRSMRPNRQIIMAVSSLVNRHVRSSSPVTSCPKVMSSSGSRAVSFGLVRLPQVCATANHHRAR